jgi:sugar phosphate isomerase/epimerase
LGVTFHSFSSEFVSYVWSFEDLMVNASRLGGGVEIVGPVHHRKFPNVPAEFVATFRSSVERNGLTPTCYGSYADPFLRWSAPLTDDELIEYTVPQIRGAAALGFPIVRLQHFAAGIVERVLPLAEGLGVTLAYELHTPLELESARTAELLEQIARLGSPRLGLIPDAGIFARSVPAFRIIEGRELGLSAETVDAVLALWSAERPRAEASALVDGAPGRDAGEWVDHLWGSFGHSDPAALGEIFEHVVHVHGKFFSIVDDDEPDIRYRELVGALLDQRYDGWISSEYEGPPADSFALVAGQQRLIRRFEAEHAAADRGPHARI